MPRKVAFVLGAGFSCTANIPLQPDLLKEIFSYKPSLTEEHILTAQYLLKKLISDFFGATNKASLEDIFTILDRCVIGKERFKNYTWQELYRHRVFLVKLILHILSIKQATIPQDAESAYYKFAKMIIQQRRRSGQQSDPIAIISSNWDTVAELFITRVLTEGQKKNTGIDYCTFTHGKGIPHIHLKAKGFYNIKILKLHGSLNWLHCSNCGRLFIDDNCISVQRKECPYCNHSEMHDNHDLVLEPLIITPTLLKELTNIHMKSIWQNAFIELQEANKIYFIGYSLPFADFEFKYILKKAIGRNTELSAILVEKDRRNGTMKRYKEFFGNRIRFNFDGFYNWATTIDTI